MKLVQWEREHYRREMNTARLVKACYKSRCQGNLLTPEKIHSLCQLTWWVIHWRSTKLPALWRLWAKRGELPTVKEPDELTAYGFPRSILACAEPATGIVNLYRAYRNSSLKWIEKNYETIGPLVHKAANLRNDREAEELANAIDKLPGIPKPKSKSGRLSPSSLLTPLFACLDPRFRFPLVAKYEEVLKLHRKLGIATRSLSEQIHALVPLIGQYGIKDVFMLDVVSGRLAERALPKPKDSIGVRERQSDRELDEKDDNDISILIRTQTIKARRLHNAMTNRLTRFCTHAGLKIYEGTGQYRYDALVKNYDSNNDLLIEAKSSLNRAQLRLAVGQLFDYRRGLPKRAVTDLAVLLPKKPNKDSFSYLADVGVHVLWYTNRKLSSIKGTAGLGLRRGRSGDTQPGPTQAA